MFDTNSTKVAFGAVAFAVVPFSVVDALPAVAALVDALVILSSLLSTSIVGDCWCSS